MEDDDDPEASYMMTKRLLLGLLLANSSYNHVDSVNNSISPLLGHHNYGQLLDNHYHQTLQAQHNNSLNFVQYFIQQQQQQQQQQHLSRPHIDDSYELIHRDNDYRNSIQSNGHHNLSDSGHDYRAIKRSIIPTRVTELMSGDFNNISQDNHSTSTNQSTGQLLLSAIFLHKHQSENDVVGIHWPNFILALILILLMLTTAIGNLFVIVAILIERNLRTIGNYLVLSLAIADLLVALLVMPLASIYLILNSWTLGVLLCDIWTSADVFSCTASILHLLAIALDRYWAVTRVDYIRCQRNQRRILFMILFVWLAASVISLAPVLGWKDDQFESRISNRECLISQDVGYQMFATCTTFWFPLTLTLVFYWKIYQNEGPRNCTQKLRKRRAGEKV